MTKTFSTLSFINVGDPYGKRERQNDRYLGKQMATKFPKEGKVDNAFFSKFLLLAGKFADTQPIRYLEREPPDKRKKGFLSGDARKRDMAMNATMGNIMSDTITKETKGQKKAKLQQMERQKQQLERMGVTSAEQQAKLEKATGKNADNARTATLVDPKRRTRRRGATVDLDETYVAGHSGPEFLFDVGRSADTRFDCKTKRDTWYEPRNFAQVCAWSNGNAVVQGGNKRFGHDEMNITSRDYGVGARELEEYTRRTKAPVEFEASPHSRRSILDQQNFRVTGALLPPFPGNSIATAGPPGSKLLL